MVNNHALLCIVMFKPHNTTMTAAGARGTEDGVDRKNLSKNVMQMKFMQKGVVKRVDPDEEMEQRIQRSKEHWVIGGLPDAPVELPYSFDTGIVMCEDLLPIGRMSFKNFNKVVEETHKQVLKQAKKKCTTTVDDDAAEDISDDEMAERFETLVQTIDSKFKGKRKRAGGDGGGVSSDSDSDDNEEAKELKKRAKRGFLKPSV